LAFLARAKIGEVIVSNNLQAVLFDLDDTLLGNNMESFVPGYFSILSEYAAERFDRRKFLQDLLLSTRAVIESTDGSTTNWDVFWGEFSARTGYDVSEMEPFFERFYAEKFGQLQAVTEFRPVAPQLVDYCFGQSWQVAIATNPLFPRTAVEQRLDWAGIPTTKFTYDLITTMENMRAAKPRAAYYQEILAYLNCPPERALMTGDSWENDIVPAANLGLFTWFIPTEIVPEPPDTAVPLTGWGTLEQLYAWLKSD
jgi:FMN phosphatase YigB (HAD superfamily)